MYYILDLRHVINIGGENYLYDFMLLPSWDVRTKNPTWDRIYVRIVPDRPDKLGPYCIKRQLTDSGEYFYYHPCVPFDIMTSRCSDWIAWGDVRIRSPGATAGQEETVSLLRIKSGISLETLQLSNSSSALSDLCFVIDGKFPTESNMNWVHWLSLEKGRGGVSDEDGGGGGGGGDEPCGDHVGRTNKSDERTCRALEMKKEIVDEDDPGVLPSGALAIQQTIERHDNKEMVAYENTKKKKSHHQHQQHQQQQPDTKKTKKKTKKNKKRIADTFSESSVSENDEDRPGSPMAAIGSFGEPTASDHASNIDHARIQKQMDQLLTLVLANATANSSNNATDAHHHTSSHFSSFAMALENVTDTEPASSSSSTRPLGTALALMGRQPARRDHRHDEEDAGCRMLQISYPIQSDHLLPPTAASSSFSKRPREIIHPYRTSLLCRNERGLEFSTDAAANTAAENKRYALPLSESRPDLEHFQESSHGNEQHRIQTVYPMNQQNINNNKRIRDVNVDRDYYHHSTSAVKPRVHIQDVMRANPLPSSNSTMASSMLPPPLPPPPPPPPSAPRPHPQYAQTPGRRCNHNDRSDVEVPIAVNYQRCGQRLPLSQAEDTYSLSYDGPSIVPRNYVAATESAVATFHVDYADAAASPTRIYHSPPPPPQQQQPSVPRPSSAPYTDANVYNDIDFHRTRHVAPTSFDPRLDSGDAVSMSVAGMGRSSEYNQPSQINGRRGRQSRPYQHYPIRPNIQNFR